VFANCTKEDFEKFKNKAGFKFKLVFPTFHEDQSYNVKTDNDDNYLNSIIWTQKSSPLHEGMAVDFEQIENPYGEAFDGLYVDNSDDRNSMFTSGGNLRVGLWEAHEGMLCGPLDTDWGEPWAVQVVELYAAVPTVAALPLISNAKDANKRHSGKVQGTAEIKNDCLCLPKGTEYGGVLIKNHEDFKFKDGFSVCMWVQKHYVQKNGAVFISKGSIDKGFSMSTVEQMDGDYLRCACRFGSGGVRKISAMFRPKEEFDLPSDPSIADVYVEDPNHTWYHIAMTCSTTSVDMYINGEHKGKKKCNGSYLFNKNDVLIGSDGGSKTLQGRVFDVYLFGTALSQTDIQSLMEEGKQRLGSIEEKIKEEQEMLAEEAKKKAAPSKAQLSAQERIRRKMQKRMAKRNRG